MTQHKKLAILVGGGPAPGINAVIGAAVIRASLSGVEVVGVHDGFRHIMHGRIGEARPLTIADVSRIHFRGGSTIGISRSNPTRDEHHLETSILSLLRLDVDKLITIGGDDTAFSAMQIDRRSEGRVRVVHVPKTIDNDLDLPNDAPTFGFETARHLGVEIVENLMVDARTTSRWYLVVTMGRKGGHLALGIGKAAGATLTVIPEEFREPRIPLRRVVDVLVGAMIKRLSYGRHDGVAVLAEGIVERTRAEDLLQLAGAERDEHGHVRLAEISFGEVLKERVQARLAEFGIKLTLVAKNIGYELRCADPIPYDMEYARDLGYCAAKYLLEGGHGALVTMAQGSFRPVPFASMLDERSGRTRLRFVDIQSDRYMIARRYMLRLRRDDFDDPSEIAKFAATAGVSLDGFRDAFGYLVEEEPVPRAFFPEATSPSSLAPVR